MLEEPEYRDVVTWTKSGDSFVVIDVSFFTLIMVILWLLLLPLIKSNTLIS